MSELFPILSPAVSSGTGVLGDQDLEYSIYLRLAEAAGAQGKAEQAEDWWKRARAAIANEQRSEVPMPFFRRALAETTAQRQAGDRAIQRAGWLQDPATARRDWVANFRPLVAQTQALAQSVSLADARARLFFVEQVDRRIDVFKSLYDALPADRAEIADMSFRLTQLRRSERTALAPVGPLVDRLDLDPHVRSTVKRLLDYQLNASIGLRNLWANLHAAVGSAPEQVRLTHDAWVALNVFFNETGPARNEYLSRLMKANPQLGVLLTPTPWPIASFTSLLRDGEALVAISSTDQGLFTWAFSRQGAAFVRSDLLPDAVTALVGRINRSLVPREATTCLGVPPFDAAASYALYRETLGKVREIAKDGMHLFWTANGPLAAVPPALLVDRPPPRDLVSGSVELHALGWTVDRHAISVLPDPSMLLLERATVQRPGRRR